MGDDPWSQFESSDHDAHTELFHRGAAHAVPSHRCVLSGLGSVVGVFGVGVGMVDEVYVGAIDWSRVRMRNTAAHFFVGFIICLA